MNIKILAIVDEENANDIMSILTELKKYSIQPIITSNILDGIDLFIENNPPILILDDKLEGFMLAKTINDMQNNKTVIFMLTKLEKILLSKEHLNINFYIPKPLNRIFLQVTIMSYLKNYIFIEKENLEIERAVKKQAENLPNKIDNDFIKINYIYSPYNKLSGDKLKLLSDEKNNKYYGIVIDCTGHDLLAWQQTGTVEIMFKYALTFLKQGIFTSIKEVLEDVNKNLVSEEIYVAATVFKIDLNQKLIKYVSAGIPNFFIKYKNSATYEKKFMKGKVLGYKIDAKYLEHTIEICNIEKIIFTTDGLTDTLNIKKNIKSDDISAFFITFK